MKKQITLIILFSLILLSGCGSADQREISVKKSADDFILEPVTREGGKPFHVAVMDLAPPIESSYLWLKGLAEGLQEIGYIQGSVDLEAAPADFDGYYRYLLEQDLGKYIKFDKNYYLVGEGNDEGIAETLRSEADAGKLDIIAVTGTTPGLFLKELDLGVPFLVSMATDPIASGIIDSAEDTGNENIWALVEPDSCSRKFEAYHSMLDFDRLGLVEVEEYEIIGGNGQYRDKAKELGVELDEIVFSEEEVSAEDYGKALLNKLKKSDLSELDGILFAYGTIHEKESEAIADYLTSRGLPLLVGDGDAIVKNGGLIYLSFFDYEGYGRYAAKVMSNVFHGQKAGSQPCIYTSPSRIVLNLATAQKMGFETDMALLRSTSRIYR